jgi:hypothetical protein
MGRRHRTKDVTRGEAVQRLLLRARERITPNIPVLQDCYRRVRGVASHHCITQTHLIAEER